MDTRMHIYKGEYVYIVWTCQTLNKHACLQLYIPGAHSLRRVFMVGGPTLLHVDLSFERFYRQNIYKGKRPGIYVMIKSFSVPLKNINLWFGQDQNDIAQCEGPTAWSGESYTCSLAYKFVFGNVIPFLFANTCQHIYFWGTGDQMRCEYLHRKGVHYAIENPMSTLLWTYKPMEASSPWLNSKTPWCMLSQVSPGDDKATQVHHSQRPTWCLWRDEWETWTKGPGIFL